VNPSCLVYPAFLSRAHPTRSRSFSRLRVVRARGAAAHVRPRLRLPPAAGAHHAVLNAFTLNAFTMPNASALVVIIERPHIFRHRTANVKRDFFDPARALIAPCVRPSAAVQSLDPHALHHAKNIVAKGTAVRERSDVKKRARPCQMNFEKRFQLTFRAPARSLVPVAIRSVIAAAPTAPRHAAASRSAAQLPPRVAAIIARAGAVPSAVR
jgi:hypothetical protein